MDAYNAFIAPIIQRYGYSDNGVQTGGGAVGGYYQFDQDNFYPGQLPDRIRLLPRHQGLAQLPHRLPVPLGEEDLIRSSNGWGAISVIGGRSSTPDGEPIFYEARIQQQSLLTDAGVAVPPIHSEIKSQSIELNDVIRANEWTFNLGFVLSNDKLYGQGLRAVDGNVSGFEVDPGSKYLMKEIDFTDMFQPRLGVTFSPNGKDALSASYAKYFPAASSLPRAASWARNSATTIRAQFDADGNLIFLDPVASSSGKVFQEGIKPRSIDEYTISYDKQLSNAWTGRIGGRYRHGTNFWEDTNNTARIAYDPPEGIPREEYVPNLDEIRAEIGGSSYVIAALDGAFTKYYELGAEAEWRGRNGYFRGSYVWSHYYGNFDQDNSTNDNDPTSSSVRPSSPTARAASCGTTARAISAATGATSSRSSASTRSPGTAPSAPSASTSRVNRGRRGAMSRIRTSLEAPVIRTATPNRRGSTPRMPTTRSISTTPRTSRSATGSTSSFAATSST